jgi:hypothetical protein
VIRDACRRHAVKQEHAALPVDEFLRHTAQPGLVTHLDEPLGCHARRPPVAAAVNPDPRECRAVTGSMSMPA